MMLEQHIHAKLETIETMLVQLVSAQPPLKKRDFARRAGMSEATLHRKLNLGQIKQRPDGRINYAELVRHNTGLRLAQG